jgi:hypothetical protein
MNAMLLTREATVAPIRSRASDSVIFIRASGERWVQGQHFCVSEKNHPN